MEQIVVRGATKGAVSRDNKGHEKVWKSQETRSNSVPIVGG